MTAKRPPDLDLSDDDAALLEHLWREEGERSKASFAGPDEPRDAHGRWTEGGGGDATTPQTYWHVTTNADDLRANGFVKGRYGAGTGGPVSGRGVSVWKTERDADRFLRDMTMLEAIRTHADPVAEAERRSNTPLKWTDPMARLWAEKLGRPLTPRERGVVHAQAAAAPYVPAQSFFHDGPARTFTKLAVHADPAHSRMGDDSEDLFAPDKVAVAPPHFSAAPRAPRARLPD